MNTINRPTVLHVFQPADGGVPAYVHDVALRLRAKGWGVVVACDPAYSGADDLRGVGVVIEPFVSRRAPSPDDLSALVGLIRMARRHQPALIHAHSAKAGLLAGFAGRAVSVPTVYTPHGWSFQMDGALLARVAFAGIEGLLARRFHEMVVPVCVNERRLARRWRVAPIEKLVVVRTGRSVVNPRASDRTEARRRIGIPSNALVAAWIGRNAAQKRPADLPVLAARVASRGALLAVLGVDLEASGIARAVMEANGMSVPEAIAPVELLAAADVLVLTSAWEGLPLVVIEALEQGVPVVAYNVGGLDEQVFPGRNGYLVPLGAIDQLAQSVSKIIADRETRDRHANEARSVWQDRFRPETMVDRIELIYEDVLRRR